ncbi:MAG: cysteine desulfurase [Hyphomicrobiaceae bacterium]
MTKLAQSAATAAFDVEGVRADFPILSREIYGKPLVYLDNGASAQKPNAVLDALDRAYRTEYANVHRGLHFLSNTATQRFEEAREIVRRFLNARSENEIIFTRNATEGINLVASSLGATFKEGDEIIVSIMEHHSNIVPWHFLRERKGCVLKWAPITDTGELDLDALDQLIGPRTRLVAITHMSNVLGTVTPAKEIVARAHAKGVPVLLDGSQAAVHLPVDMQDLDCDFYVFTGHKVYGPTGIGALYAKSKYLERMQPYMGGGEMIELVTTDTITYAQAPHKFEAGTPAIAEAIGLGAALDYMMSKGREQIAAHEADLAHYAHERLAGMNWLTIYGNAPGKGAIVSFNIDGLHPHDVSTIIDRSGVAVRAGHACAQPLMTRLGITAACRASFAMYNTRAEVDELAEALVKAHDFFA